MTTATDNLAPATDLLATLQACNAVPSSIHIEWPYTTQDKPTISVFLRRLEDFETVTTMLGLKTGDATGQPGQHNYYTTGDTGPLIQYVAFAHHRRDGAR